MTGDRTDNLVIIAGGGVGGLATALTLHQIGVPCIVLEAVREMRPLGVGINLQPNAVRELYDLGFTRYCVSLKDSDPQKVIEVNRRFAELRPDVPLHLGVTEAGLPPDGIIKTRIAFEQLIGFFRTPRTRWIIGKVAWRKRLPDVQHRRNYAPSRFYHVGTLE